MRVKRLRRKVLRQYQDELLNWMVEQRHPALFVEMRLGKTLTAIRWCEAIGAKRILVVAPATVCIPWQEELASEGEKVVPVTGPPAKRVELAQRRVDGRCFWLISYASLRATSEIARNYNSLVYDWDVVIADESTALKNPSATITKIMTGGFRDVPNRCILSGYPNPESLLDYFSQFEFLFGGMCGFSNYWSFRGNLFDGDERGWDYWPLPGTRDRIKDWVDERSFYLTKKMCGMGNKKIRQRRVIEWTPAQRKEYRLAEDAWRKKNRPKRGTALTKWAVEKVTWMHRIAGGFAPDGRTLLSNRKAKEVTDLMTGELREEQVVIWCHFKVEIRHLLDELKKHRIEATALVGGLSKSVKQRRLNKFRSGDAQVIVCQGAVGMYGLNLSVASTCIYYSNGTSGEERVQNEERIAMPGKSEPLLYIDLVTEDSIDVDIRELLLDKETAAKGVLTQLTRRFTVVPALHE